MFCKYIILLLASMIDAGLIDVLGLFHYAFEDKLRMHFFQFLFFFLRKNKVLFRYFLFYFGGLPIPFPSFCSSDTFINAQIYQSIIARIHHHLIISSSFHQSSINQRSDLSINHCSYSRSSHYIIIIPSIINQSLLVFIIII